MTLLYYPKFTERNLSGRITFLAILHIFSISIAFADKAIETSPFSIAHQVSMHWNGLSKKGWYEALWILLFFVIWLPHPALSQSVRFPQPDKITDRQGLPQAFVESIVQDHSGFIWVATRDGLCRYDGRTFRVFQPDPTGRPSLSFAGVGMLKLDYRGRIWIASERGDLDLFDPKTETFVNVSNQPAYKRLLGLNGITGLCFDRKGRLWVAFSEKGLGCIDTRTGQLRRYAHQAGQPYSLLSNRVVGIVEDRQGQIWMATSKGLDRFDEKKSRFIPVSISTESRNDSLSGLYLRSNGEFLIGAHRSLTVLNPHTGTTRIFPLTQQPPHWNPMQFAVDSRGVVYIVDNGRPYCFSDQDGLQLLDELNGPDKLEHCQSLWIDQSDVLWLGTTGAGIRKYDLRANRFQTAPYRSSFHTDLLTNWLGVKQGLSPEFTRNTDGYTFRYTVDRQGALWFNAHSTPFQRLDLATGQLTNIDSPIPRLDTSVALRNIRTLYQLTTDPQGRIWTLHNFQVWWYDSVSTRWIPFNYPLKIRQPASVWQLVVDQEALWIATDRTGLYRVDRRTGAHRQFTYQANDATSLSNNNLFCLSADPTDANRLWIGTFGSGLCVFDKRTGKSRRLTVADGLPNNVTYSAIPDQQGHLWIGTNKGLVRMNRKTFEMRTYTRNDGLMADEFNRFHFLQLPDGHIFMGGIEGITAFYPQEIHDDSFKPKTEITRILINNQPLRLSSDPAPDSATVPYWQVHVLQQLTLPYNQNFLTVDFAVMQFNKLDKNRYRYRLEGIDKHWVETERPEAIYTDLSPGQYVLNLNASNTSGVWSPHIRTLIVTIQPPLWATWWAYLLYGITLLSIAYSLFRAYLNRLQLKQTMALKDQEARQLREVDEMKNRFFSNITHEFRTPLTLILAPTQQLQQKHRETDDQRRLRTIEKNTYQLLGLINQLMDLAKIESSTVTIQESRGHLDEFVDLIVQSFQGQAELKQIDIRYQPQLTGEYWFDQHKLERIVNNLIANALKFTNTGGQVVIELTALTRGGVQLMVSDTGIGIPADKLPYIFNRFYQVDDSSTGMPHHPQEGTGIGLALVKELIDLQQGQIDVTSKPGVGTTFRIDLPFRRVIPLTTNLPDRADNFPPDTAVPETVAEDGAPESPVVLLVEDNLELADFIAESLPATYRIYRATNGADGIEQALHIMPDLVLSDVLMPITDGYTLCDKLKKDLRTSHIPVVLLTAKSALESRVTGLTAGADDYITKPFHLPELQLRIRNLLDGRQRLREWVRLSLTQPDTSETSPEPAPVDTFLPMLYNLLDKNLDDTTFGVDQLTTEIGMSRATLYRKIRAVSSLPVNELIQNYRLKRAAHYLRQGRTVAETAYLVGFDSPSYFSRCFRKLYQLTPTEFANGNR